MTGSACQTEAHRQRGEGVTGEMYAECQTDQRGRHREQEAHKGLAQGLTLQAPERWGHGE